ncbi:hypothetical protein WJX79_001225 [Trebouxia sp. C0005]
MQRSEAEAQEVTGSNLDEHPLLSDRTISVEDSLQIRSMMGNNIILLTIFGGIGGFLFGYDTGVISGALPYLRDDLLVHHIAAKSRLVWIQEVIVSAAVLGAGVGSAIGGWFSDQVGRKKALLVGDVLFTLGALLMAAAGSPNALIAGRAFVGLGVGLASVTVPVYIAESAPPSVRATLVTVNVLMITTGQFVAYLVDFLCTFLPGTWRWMLGVAAVPSVLQLAGLLFLPESPKWLASKGQHEAAEQALRSLRGPDQIEADLAEMQAAAEEESKARSWALLRSPVVRSELQVGLGLQILQQLGGINTVMYYTPAILELAGLRDNRTALLVAMLPAAVKSAGTLIGMWQIDKCGRRKLMLSSMAGVVIALLLLGYAFHLAEGDSPQVTPGASTTCPAPDCAACLHQACIFCGSKDDPMLPGFCIASDKQCSAAAQGALMLYLAAFSPGMGPVPWAVNAEIYPVQLRGLGGGAAATCNWITNAVVSQTFLTLIQHLGGSGTFWLYAVIALSGAVWVSSALPETNGLSLEEVQELFNAKHGSAPGLQAGDTDLDVVAP